MSTFDKIIGYTSIKKELERISDTLKNRETYDRLGVYPPRGLLLYGRPGVGKSLMASAVIEDSGRKVFCCRKDAPNGDFVKKIKATFDKALQNAPSIVYLDDMDKFANSDERHLNAEEYVTIQSCIDEIKDKQVFVLATANHVSRLPRSLLRAGRFDRMISVDAPRGEDAMKIISHYLKSKHIVDEIDPTIIAKIMDGRSCAALETVINEAGLYAGYEHAESITMDHLMQACLRVVFDMPEAALENYGKASKETISENCNYNNTDWQVAYHEAGHAVISEVLCPESTTLISTYNKNGESGGFTSYYNDNTQFPIYWKKSRIIVSLGGVAAIEQKFGLLDSGCEDDFQQAFYTTRDLVVNTCISGFHLHGNGMDESQRLLSEQEKAVSIEIEKYYKKAKEILSLNRDFFERIAVALAKKRLLSAADIQKIKSECEIVSVAV